MIQLIQRRTDGWNVCRSSFWEAARKAHATHESLESLPSFTLRDTGGREVRSQELVDRPTVLVLSSPHCAPCSALYPVIRELSMKSDHVRLVLLSRGARNTNKSLKLENGLDRVLVLGARKKTEEALGAGGTPFAALVSAGGYIFWKGGVTEDLLRQLVHSAEHPLISATS